jgi:hypothetical protein
MSDVNPDIRRQLALAYAACRGFGMNQEDTIWWVKDVCEEFEYWGDGLPVMPLVRALARMAEQAGLRDDLMPDLDHLQIVLAPPPDCKRQVPA